MAEVSIWAGSSPADLEGRAAPSCLSLLWLCFGLRTCNLGKRPLGPPVALLFLRPAAPVPDSGTQAQRYKTAEQINKPPPAPSSPATPPLSPSPTPSSSHSLPPSPLEATLPGGVVAAAAAAVCPLSCWRCSPALVLHQRQMRNTCLEPRALSSRGHFKQNVCASESQAWVSGVPKEHRFMVSASPGASVWPLGPEPFARHRKSGRKGLICTEEP